MDIVGMKQTQLLTNVSMAMMNQTQDLVQTQFEGILDMVESLPKVSGHGDLLDVVA